MNKPINEQLAYSIILANYIIIALIATTLSIQVLKSENPTKSLALQRLRDNAVFLMSEYIQVYKLLHVYHSYHKRLYVLG